MSAIRGLFDGHPSALLTLALAALALPFLPGCPSNMCLLTVNGKCEYSSCGGREFFDNKRKVCLCQQGYLTLGGGCMTQVEANQHCGKGAVFGPRGCEAIACAPGYVLDNGSDQCVPKAAVDQAAGVAPGQTLACAPGTVLVVNQGQSSCVPLGQTCQKDEVFNGQACMKTPTCAAGSDFDTTSMTCVVVSQRPTGGDEMATIDTQQWARSNFGPAGGNGSPGLCGPLAKKPLLFGVLPGGSIRLVINLNLTFANGITESVAVATQSTVEAGGQPVAPKGAEEVQKSAETLIQSLRARKDKASQGQVTTMVKCLIVNAQAPYTVPSTGGA